MTFVAPSPLLRQALLLDAVITGALTIVQLAAVHLLSNALALPKALLLSSGIFLTAYVLLLLVMQRAVRLPKPLVLLVIAGNVGWAFGCLAILLTDSVVPTVLGVMYVCLQAGAVLLFASLEYAGLRRSNSNDGFAASPAGLPQR